MIVFLEARKPQNYECEKWVCFLGGSLAGASGRVCFSSKWSVFYCFGFVCLIVFGGGQNRGSVFGSVFWGTKKPPNHESRKRVCFLEGRF